MSRRNPAAREEGFTLVEVLVALTLFALFTTAVVPLVITALRAGTVAKLDTGAKNLAQERLEKMRTRDFSTPTGVGAGPDLLDTYFPGTAAAAGTEANGFVSATAARVTGEPAGPFYRYLVPASEIAPDAATASTFSRYRQRVATQFLTPAGAPLVPPAAWNALASPADEALPSPLVRATVLTTWTSGTLTKRYVLSTELTDGRAAPPIARAELRATAVRLSSSYPAADGSVSDLLLEAGVLTADGQLARGAKSSASARAGFASLVPGARIDAASNGASSPADATTPPGTNGVLELRDGSLSVLAALGAGSVGDYPVTSAGGLYAAGSVSKPLRAEIGSGSRLELTNRPNLVDPQLRVATALPVVRSLQVGGETTTATGQVSSSGGGTHDSRTTASLRTATLAVLPTDFAPEGLVQVQLLSSTATCRAGTAATAPTMEYSARFRHWRVSGVTEGYSAWTPLAHTATSDPLAALLTPSPVVAHLEAGVPVTYDRYFGSLASATVSSLTAQRLVAAPRYEANHPGVVTLTTKSLRTDLESPVTVALGVASCRTEDRR